MRTACSLFALSSLLGPVAQDPCTLDAKLPLPVHQLPLEDEDDFGWAVAADGARVVAGIPNFDGHGAVAVFGRRSGTWVVEGFLQPTGLQGGEQFGVAVSIDADLGLGDGAATVWTCDFSEGYVKINAEYRT